MIKLRVDNLSYSIKGKNIINNINLEIKDGEFIGIIGPNGSGKSTFLKNIYRLYKPDSGQIILTGNNIKKMRPKQIAKEMAVLSQENNQEFDFTVKEMVSLGRDAIKGIGDMNNKFDSTIIKDSIDYVGLSGFEERSFMSLSGGEKQRVLIARALAQKSDFLILDEPTNHLDIGYQYQLLKMIKSQNKTVFAAIHDLNMAVSICDKILVLNRGEVVSFGEPENVISTELIKDVFNTDAYIDRNKVTNKLNIVYIC